MSRFYDRVMVVGFCKRCNQRFTYRKVTKPRFYCDPCKRLEHLDACKVSSRVSYLTKVKPRREAARAARATGGS